MPTPPPDYSLAARRCSRIAMRLRDLPAGDPMLDASLHGEALRLGLLPANSPALPYSTDPTGEAVRALLPSGWHLVDVEVGGQRTHLSRCGPPGAENHNGMARTRELARLAAIWRAWGTRLR